MKSMYYLFLIIWIVAPLILIPFWSNIHDDWYFLIGIAFWFLGVFLAKNENKLILVITPALIIYWFIKGFHFSDYITFFYFSLMAGYVMFSIARGYNSQMDD
jgi:hypothetical protein